MASVTYELTKYARDWVGKEKLAQRKPVVTFGKGTTFPALRVNLDTATQDELKAIYERSGGKSALVQPASKSPAKPASK